jgi:hypothetical protein
MLLLVLQSTVASFHCSPSELRKDELVCPTDVSASDWEFNLRRAQRVLAGKNHSTGPWTAAEVAKKLVRGCRTYLIRGFRINVVKSREPENIAMMRVK